MALDTSNNVRVDLQEIYNSAEEQSDKHAREYASSEDSKQNIVICQDDYRLIHAWAMEAAVLIADYCNYITSTSQTGLDAISNPYSDGNPNPNDEVENVRLLTQNQKQTDEYLSKESMDTLQFNVEQMQGMTPLKYSITQSQIRAVIIEYILFKWYELNKITDAMSMKWQQVQYWLGQLQTNSLNNQKAINARKSYNLF